MSKTGLLFKYKDLLPITPKTPMFSLGEGDTPLVRSRSLEKMVGCGELYFKLEGCNPTGSFKDRGMIMAIAKAVEEGSQAVMCASTGNTSASAAAYAASQGLETTIIIPEGKIALGKLAQAIMHGAKIVSIEGNFDQALNMVRELTRKHPVTLVNSINPYRIEGQKTGAFEIIETLGDAPDFVFIPVGNAGNITAYWKGFVEYHRLGKSGKKPRMMGFQAAGAGAASWRPLPPGPDEGGQLGRGQGLAVEVALELAAAQADEPVALGLGLDILGDHREGQGLAQLDDRADELAANRIGHQPGDQGAVDLHRIEDALLEVEDRGGAHPEIVHGQLDPQGADLVHPRHR